MPEEWILHDLSYAKHVVEQVKGLIPHTGMCDIEQAVAYGDLTAAMKHLETVLERVKASERL